MKIIFFIWVQSADPMTKKNVIILFESADAITKGDAFILVESAAPQ
jgi:hypothetical protein